MALLTGIDLELFYSAKHASGFLCSALVYPLKQEKESKHNAKTENFEIFGIGRMLEGKSLFLWKIEFHYFVRCLQNFALDKIKA